MKVYLIRKYYNKRIHNIIHTFDLQHDEYAQTALVINSDSLEFFDRSHPEIHAIKIDFASKENNYRCLNFSKKNEILSKVVGIKKKYFPFVLDATAGFGKDAFILSFLGCKVLMIERHPIIAALLEDGLQRGYKDKKIGHWLQKRLSLIFGDSNKMLEMPIRQPDVVYLDPMYPICKKQTLPKKNIQFLRKLIGINDDAQYLLHIAKNLAKKRIVIKRPYHAKSISNEKVDFIIASKNHRFDIYYPYKK